MKRLHGSGFCAVFNNAWTRDPLEAMYRYGIDYRRIAGTGIDGCMPEDVAAGLAILSENDNGYLMNDAQRRRIHYEFQTALMLNRAVMPDLKLTPLSGIHDTNEQWGVLEHMPTSMARQVMANLNCFLFTGSGFRPVTDGPFFCLSDSMRSCDWEFIRKIWAAGYTQDPVMPSGAVLLWSDDLLDRELEALCAERRTPTFKYVSELKYAGALINAVARAEDLEKLRAPLLVTNFDLLPDSEKQAVLAYTGGIVFTIGPSPVTGNGFSVLVREDNAFGRVYLCAKGTAVPQETVENAAAFDFDPKNSPDALNGLWTHPLIYPPVSEEFYGKCADCLNGLCETPGIRVSGGRVCKLHCTYTSASGRTCKVIVVNDDYYYNIPLIDMKRKIRSVRCLTKYEGYKVSCSDSCFSSRIPPRGAEAFEIELD